MAGSRPAAVYVERIDIESWSSAPPFSLMFNRTGRFGLLFALCGLGFLGSLQASNAGVLVAVNEQTQTMSVTIEGLETYRWKVSTGRAGMATPTGTFRPFRMERDHFSKEWDDSPMPYSIFFTPDGHAIHGTLSTWRLGKPVSHGCIRLDPRNAAILYDIVTAEGLGNTQVVITNGLPALDDMPQLIASSLTQSSQLY